MTEDRKLASRSPAGSDRFTSSAAEKRPGSTASGRAASSAPSSLEDALRALAAARSELAIVRSERDRLQRELATLGAMQTETIALTADDEAAGLSETLPTLDELMAGLNTFQEAATDTARGDPSPDDSVMLAPELVFEPDDEDDDPRTRPIVPLKRQDGRGRDGGRNDDDREPSVTQTSAPVATRGRKAAAPVAAPSAPAAPAALSTPTALPAQIAPAAPAVIEPDENAASALVVVAALEEAAVAPPVQRKRNSRLLVFVDAEPPIKYPLYKAVMTVGRSETADIRVDGDYISRVHARITTAEDGTVTAEDVASKNGIRVNGKEVKHHVLQHGDVLSLGKLHFTFIDTTAADKS